MLVTLVSNDRKPPKIETSLWGAYIPYIRLYFQKGGYLTKKNNYQLLQLI
jgi:hypothetical protein